MINNFLNGTFFVLFKKLLVIYELRDRAGNFLMDQRPDLCDNCYGTTWSPLLHSSGSFLPKENLYTIGKYTLIYFYISQIVRYNEISIGIGTIFFRFFRF